MPEVPASRAIELMEMALASLENVLSGHDGWGCEIEVAAIDQLRDALGKPPRCLRCCVEGHGTYSHYGVTGVYGKDWPLFKVPDPMVDLTGLTEQGSSGDNPGTA
jgi:hypothetical protein